MQKRWDIFCKVVDNFGDIGVCWRLARQLHAEHGLQIRLWIDDLEAAQSIIPSLNIAENSQICDAVTILKWSAEADFSQTAEVVIEAFACGLPPAYLAVMAQNKLAGFESKWVNLEYLSAEPWVDDFHAKPSPQANGLTRYFYFPGFTEATGGLIREAGITTQLQAHINPPPLAGEGARQRGRGAAQVDLDVAPLSNLSPASGREAFVGDALNISLFCYPNAAIADLFNALGTNNHVVSVYVPESSILPQIAQFFGKDSVKAGDKLTQNNLTVEILPFLSQAEYDKLLSECDLNFVRGEDSWIRAIWARKPFIWQPYIQDENAHMKKLDAFLNLFYASFDKKQSACEAHRYWSAGKLPEAILAAYLNDLKAIHTHTQLQSAALASQPDLAAKLVIFCNKI